jgi:hypothetical protein
MPDSGKVVSVHHSLGLSRKRGLKSNGVSSTSFFTRLKCSFFGLSGGETQEVAPLRLPIFLVEIPCPEAT